MVGLRELQVVMDLKLKTLALELMGGRHLLHKGLILLTAVGIYCVIFSNLEMADQNFDDYVPQYHFGSVLRSFALANGLLKRMYAVAAPVLGSVRPGQNGNVILAVFKEIMNEGLLDNGSKAICLGEGSDLAVSVLRELGFPNAVEMHQLPLFMPYMYKLDDYMGNSFDLVFSDALEKISVPALLVLEIERLLRPGGTGAMISGSRNLYSGGLIRSATHIAAYLKSSDVVNVRAVGPFTLVMFKKRFDKVSAFEHYRLPEVCPSVSKNKQIMQYLEPILQKRHGKNSAASISYIPKYINISARNRLVYINIGAGEYVNSSIHNWLKPLYCPMMCPRAPHVYVIDSNVSAVTSYIKSPGITFIYHPGLSGSGNKAFTSIGEMDEQLEDERFDFIKWFKETITPADFVILAMNAKAMEMKLLFELYESGGICHVDELFILCSDGADCKSSICGNCTSLYQSLRNSGVYVHRWFGN